MRKTKNLFIFDFDDTLIKVKAPIFLISGKKRIPLSVSKFYDYHLKPGEYFDFDVFDNEEIEQSSYKIVKPVWEIFEDKYQTHGKDAIAICTARSEDGPVIRWLSGKGYKIKVAAVGIHPPGVDCAPINAKRKRKWIESAIVHTGAENIEFWDDKKININAVLPLKKKYPHLNIKCHWVKQSSNE